MMGVSRFVHLLPLPLLLRIFPMTHSAYSDPHRQTLDDLDPESATTDRLIAMVRRHRTGEDYPTPEQLLVNLPVVLRALCDHPLSGEATALDAAYRLASCRRGLPRTT